MDIVDNLKMILNSDAGPAIFVASILVTIFLAIANLRMRRQLAEFEWKSHRQTYPSSRGFVDSTDEANRLGYTNADGRTLPENLSETAETQKDKDDDEEKREYTYDDPNFALPPVVPDKEMHGSVTDKNGDAVYGNDRRYIKDLYYGRVSGDAKLELRDRRVYKNEFELDIVKVKVLSNEWSDEVGKICWVGLDATTFRDQYNPNTRLIELA